MPGILEFYPEIGFSLFKMCRILSIATFSVQVVKTSNSFKRAKTAEKDKAISSKPPVMTFVWSLLFTDQLNMEVMKLQKENLLLEQEKPQTSNNTF